MDVLVSVFKYNFKSIFYKTVVNILYSLECLDELSSNGKFSIIFLKNFVL